MAIGDIYISQLDPSTGESTCECNPTPVVGCCLYPVAFPFPYSYDDLPEPIIDSITSDPWARTGPTTVSAEVSQNPFIDPPIGDLVDIVLLYESSVDPAFTQFQVIAEPNDFGVSTDGWMIAYYDVNNDQGWLSRYRVVSGGVRSCLIGFGFDDEFPDNLNLHYDFGVPGDISLTRESLCVWIGADPLDPLVIATVQYNHATCKWSVEWAYGGTGEKEDPQNTPLGAYTAVGGSYTVS